MRPIRTTDCNATLTLPGGTQDNDLPAVRGLVYDASRGQTETDASRGFVTRWMPDEAEARQLEAGGMVQLTVWGNGHPPVAVSVTPGVMPERELITRGHVDRALGLLYGEVQQRLRDALTQVFEEAVTLDELRRGFDTVGTEVIGMPQPAAFADHWATCVERTRDDPAPGPLDVVPDDAGAMADVQTVPAPPYADCTAPDRACPFPARCTAHKRCVARDSVAG